MSTQAPPGPGDVLFLFLPFFGVFSHEIVRFHCLRSGLVFDGFLPPQARDQIRIVGSSTVFPFSTAVAEYFGGSTNFKTPVIESTGTGGGMKLFCAGLGTKHPDFSNASRRIKASEVEACAKNGVDSITEIMVGYDGIVFANSVKGPSFDLTLRQLFLALAKRVPSDEEGNPDTLIANPYKNWNEIDPSLPDLKIEVIGPPPTSGTRDAFNELAIEGGCKTFPALKAYKKQDKKAYKAICRAIREDGTYVEAGENDNLILQKLAANPVAFGVFGYSFLDQNLDKVKGAKIDNVAPTFEAIADGEYPVARSLYFYVKNSHVGVIPGMAEFITAFTDEDAWGDDGYLSEKGLIPLPADMREKVGNAARSLTPLSM